MADDERMKAPVAFAQIMRDRSLYRSELENGSLRRGTPVAFFEGARLDPFSVTPRKVEYRELRQLFDVSCAGIAGREGFVAGMQGPSTHRFRADFLLDEKGYMKVRVTERERLPKPEGGERSRTFDRAEVSPLGNVRTMEVDSPGEALRSFLGRVDGFCRDYAGEVTRNVDRIGRWNCVREVRVEVAGMAGAAKAAARDPEARGPEPELKVDSLDSYKRGKLEMMEIRDGCIDDARKNTEFARKRYDALEKAVDEFAGRRKMMDSMDLPEGQRISAERIVAYVKETREEEKKREVVLGQGQEDDRKAVPASRLEEEVRYVENLAENARYAGYAREDVRRLVDLEVSEDYRYDAQIDRAYDRGCTRAEHRRLEHLDRSLDEAHARGVRSDDEELHVRTVSDDMADRMEDHRRAVEAALFLAVVREEGLRDAREVADRLVESGRDADVDLRALAALMEVDPKEFEENYYKAVDSRMEKVWASQGDGTLQLAGEAKIDSHSKLSAVDILAREMQANALLLHRENPAECGRYLAEAGVCLAGEVSPASVFRDAAMRMYGDGGVTGAQRTQVFRERFQSSVREATKSATVRLGASQTQVVAAKPKVAPPPQMGMKKG